jgi:hypothetical protein
MNWNNSFQSQIWSWNDPRWHKWDNWFATANWSITISDYSNEIVSLQSRIHPKTTQEDSNDMLVYNLRWIE